MNIISQSELETNQTEKCLLTLKIKINKMAAKIKELQYIYIYI